MISYYVKMRLEVAQNREVFGYLIIQNGRPAEWESANTPLARFFENGSPGQMPNTFKFLEPEGWLAKTLGIGCIAESVAQQNAYFQQGVRFLSNITIAQDTSAISQAIDLLDGKLESTTEDGVFQGKYEGPSAQSFDEQFGESLAVEWVNNPMMPKFSGAQVKIPMTLFKAANPENAVLKPAQNTAFTHILKVPREDFYESFPTIEWLGLELSEAIGIPTAAHALVEMPEGMAPSLVVERFDIHDIGDPNADHVAVRLADFCNITGLEPKQNKYSTEIDICFAQLSKISEKPEEDIRTLFKRVALSYFIGDNDMHLKNLSVLKTFDKATGDIQSRISPTYDAMTTAIYPDFDEDKEFALSFHPNPDDEQEILRPIELENDLVEIAGRAGIPEEEAEAMLEEIGGIIAQKATEIVNNPPEIVKAHPMCELALKCALTAIYDRVATKDAAPYFDDYTYPPMPIIRGPKVAIGA